MPVVVAVTCDKDWQVSGGINMVFANEAVANAYHNLTNIIFRIAPKSTSMDSPPKKALLLNAHYDTIFGTRGGASDCASCVGVLIEAALNIVAGNKTLDGPLVFLFNGGEEVLLLAAHGFMASSNLAGEVGAFNNLESTGPGGPSYLFQHRGVHP